MDAAKPAREPVDNDVASFCLELSRTWHSAASVISEHADAAFCDLHFDQPLATIPWSDATM